MCVHLTALSGALFTVTVECCESASERNVIAAYTGGTNMILGISFVEHLGSNKRNRINTGGDKTWIITAQQFHGMLVLAIILPEDAGEWAHLTVSAQLLKFEFFWTINTWNDHTVGCWLFFSVYCLFCFFWKVSWLAFWLYPQTLKWILNMCSKLL